MSLGDSFRKFARMWGLPTGQPEEQPNNVYPGQFSVPVTMALAASTTTNFSTPTVPAALVANNPDLGLAPFNFSDTLNNPNLWSGFFWGFRVNVDATAITPVDWARLQTAQIYVKTTNPSLVEQYVPLARAAYTREEGVAYGGMVLTAGRATRKVPDYQPFRGARVIQFDPSKDTFAVRSPLLALSADIPMSVELLGVVVRNQDFIATANEVFGPGCQPGGGADAVQRVRLALARPAALVETEPVRAIRAPSGGPPARRG